MTAVACRKRATWLLARSRSTTIDGYVLVSRRPGGRRSVTPHVITGETEYVSQTRFLIRSAALIPASKYILRSARTQ